MPENNRPTPDQLAQFFTDLGVLPKIPDPPAMVDLNKAVPVHLAYLRANPGNSVYLPYYLRLCRWKSILENLEQGNIKTGEKQAL